MRHDFDVITVGGGVAGASLARTLALQGVRVLVLERETQFRDRVRGEYVHPWGVSEIRRLGLETLLKQAGALEAVFRDNQIVGRAPNPLRNMIETTPHRAGSLNLYHPKMQQVLLDAAAEAGATVYRSVRVNRVKPGAPPTVAVSGQGGTRLFEAKLVVGADGRNSVVRSDGNFITAREGGRMKLAGLLLDGVNASDTATHASANPRTRRSAFQLPQGGGRFRCYAGFYLEDGHHSLNGDKDVAEFIMANVLAGSPQEWFEKAVPAGPLATFDCTETFVHHPFHSGVVLIGDAAATSDPSFGCGLALTVRDVRVLAEKLLNESDWDRAAAEYAAEHRRYTANLRRLLGWQTRLLFERGERAAERRARAFDRLDENPKRMPDIVGLGPEAPSDAQTYRELFGEEPENPHG